MPTEYDLAYRQYGTGLPYQNNPTSPQVKTISRQQPEPQPELQPTPTPVVSVRGQVHTIRGRNYYRFTSTSLPNGMYAEGDWIMDDPSVEGNYERAVQNTARFLGINRWDIAGQEKTAPAGIDLSATQRRLSAADAITKAQEANVRSQQAFMKTNWGGRPMAASARAVVDAPVGTNIKQYEQAVPIERKQIAMKRGMLENTKTWASTKAYEDAYAQVSRSTKVTPQKEIFVPAPLKEQEKQFDNKIIPSPTHDDLVRYDAMRIKAGAEQGSVYVERFGKMVPRKEDTTNRDVLRDTSGGRFAQQSYEWGEDTKAKIDKLNSGSVQDTYANTLMKFGTDTVSSAGMIVGGARAITEQPVAFIKEIPGATIKATENLPSNVIGTGNKMFVEPIVKRGVIIGGVEAGTNVLGVIVTGKAIGVAGKSISVVKNMRPKLTFTQTSELKTIPGMGVVVRKRIRPKLELIQKTKPKEPEVEVLDLTKEDQRVIQEAAVRNMRTTDPTKIKTIQSDVQNTKQIPIQKVYTAGDLLGYEPTKGKLVQKQKAKTEAHTGDELRGISGYTDTPTYTWEDPIFLRQLAEARASEKAIAIQKAQPSFAEYSALTGAQAAGQIQRTRQIAGQLTRQQTKQVQSTSQLTGLKSLNITAQTTKQKTNTEQIVSPVSVTKTAQVQSPFTIQSPAMDTVTVQTPKTTTKQIPRTTTTTTIDTPTRTPTKPKIPKYPKILDESEDFPEGKDKKKKKGIKKYKSAIASPDFWYPASYESVTKEELSLGGRRATHIGRQEKKKTSTLYGKKIVTRGKPIPTKRQFKASDLL